MLPVACIVAAACQASGPSGPTEAPVLLSGPTLDNLGPVVGTPISVTNGTWSNSPTSFAYQWFQNNSSTPILGATASSYTAQAGDAGQALFCQVTASNDAGSGDPASSDETDEVIANTVAPNMTSNGDINNPLVNDQFSVDNGTWDGFPAFAYLWHYQGSIQPIGANMSNYAPGAQDVGFSIQCQVTGTSSTGEIIAVDSNATGVVGTPV